MRLRPSQYITVSQTILGLSLLASVLIIPDYFLSHNQGGVSNYGTSGSTQALFVVGFGSAAIGSLLAGLRLGGGSPRLRRLKIGLFGISLLYLLVMVSTFPYKLSPAYTRLHQEAAVTLFAAMLAIVIWLLLTGTRDRKSTIAAGVFFLGFMIAGLTQVGVLHLLFTAQLVCGSSFAYLLAHGVSAYHYPSSPDQQ